MISLFFFKGYGAPRDLHSFPTRRSPDLGWVSVGVEADTAAFAVESIRRWGCKLGKARHPEAGRLTITADCGGSNGAARRPRRSEEHTSELQSRQYLVCRLLLEKKKKIYN